MTSRSQVVAGVIARYNGVPFTYGVDCCQLAGDCVEAITGKNPMWRFFYKDKRGALEILKRLDGLENAMTLTLGEPYEGFEDGDICLVQMVNGDQAAGIAYQGRVVVRTKRDLMDLPRTAAKKVWRNV